MVYKKCLITGGGNYVTSRKTILKVSDVCQLLDKSKFPATQTVKGVTFTNNGDGTITVNGAVTGGTIYYLIQSVKYTYGHIYLLWWTDTNSTVMKMETYNGEVQIDVYNGGIFTAKTNKSQNVYIDVYTSYNPDNVTVKPQIFDLTEMYGAGNEPKTVAEFREKFPEEMYNYSPRCWVESHKTGLIAKTKNLFNISKLTAYTPETLPNNTAGVYNGNIIAKAGSGSSIGNSNKTLKELCPDLVAGETYTMNFDTNGTGSQAYIIYLSSTKYVWKRGTSKTITESDLTGKVFFYANYPDFTVATISNFQLELGSTATDYVPYGYL